MRILRLSCLCALAACSAPGPAGLLDDPGAPGLVVKPHLVRAETGWLAIDDATRPPVERARAFLDRYRGIAGTTTAAVRGIVDDATTGRTHVRLAQRHGALPVIGGELVVHLDGTGVTAVAGTWLPVDGVATVPVLDEAAALRVVGGSSAKLAVVHTGVLRGVAGEPRLAWVVEVAGERRSAAWVDAITGAVLEAYPLDPEAKHRMVYSPQYLAAAPDLFVLRREGQAPTNLPMVDHLYDYSGQVYDLFGALGRDSYDGAGARMRTVYLVDQNCPNAYWNGTTTNYCPLFDLDDVVAHEWSHAYTQFTHGLIYAYQSGALNEAYSDIFGETVDLLNGVDGLAGGANSAPAPAGVRWAVGEDFVTGHGEYELLLRDMWDPDRLGDPGKVSSTNYACGSDDGGGVHTNSGVPNHAYALLVDGGTYNGVTVGGIGLVKAAHIYFRAMTAYQVPTTTFAQHADALEASCADLVGLPLAGFLSAPSPGTLTVTDCAQVAAAMLAVEMRSAPPCTLAPQLAPGAPAACSGAVRRFTEDWSDGLAGWTTTSSGVNPEWPNTQWVATSAIPAGRTGAAAFAVDRTDGTCAAGGDYSGVFRIDSPELLAPANRLELRFDHYVETELGYDGGNLWLSKNGGAYAQVPAAAFKFNGPARTLEPGLPLGQNTNPKAGQSAWTGADEGGPSGSWGTTVVDLASLVAPGDRFRLRFEFGQDGCNGATGWYVGALAVDECPTGVLPPLRRLGL